MLLLHALLDAEPLRKTLVHHPAYSVHVSRLLIMSSFVRQNHIGALLELWADEVLGVRREYLFPVMTARLVISAVPIQRCMNKVPNYWEYITVLLDRIRR